MIPLSKRNCLIILIIFCFFPLFTPDVNAQCRENGDAVEVQNRYLCYNGETRAVKYDWKIYINDLIFLDENFEPTDIANIQQYGLLGQVGRNLNLLEYGHEPYQQGNISASRLDSIVSCAATDAYSQILEFNEADYPVGHYMFYAVTQFGATETTTGNINKPCKDDTQVSIHREGNLSNYLNNGAYALEQSRDIFEGYFDYSRSNIRHEPMRKIELVEKDNELRYEFPYNVDALNVSYKIFLASGECPDGYECSKEGALDERSGELNISQLYPYYKSSESELGEDIATTYRIAFYFPCNGEVSPATTNHDVKRQSRCTVLNGIQEFVKDEATHFDFEMLGDLQSNEGVAACSGSVECANCVARTLEGNRFGSFQEAASDELSGNIIYTNNIYSALGCVDPSQDGLTTRILQIAMGVIGGLILIRFGQAVVILQSGNNPEAQKEGMEIAVSALIALFLLISSVVGLRFIGINVFYIFSPGTIEIGE